MKAKVVVDLGFGDSGKGITTDYLVSKYPDTVVVRYCGGHQAGHTVIKDGVKHIHSSYGSGVMRGAPSYLSEFCCFYPPNMQRELEVLREKGVNPIHYIHPLAKLTTPYDVAFNRLREKKLGHGSVGVGIGATLAREQSNYKLHAADIKSPAILNAKLEQIKKYYESQFYEYNAKEIKYFRETVEMEMVFFQYALRTMEFNIAPYKYLLGFKHVIFEGAQGILLDMDFGVFPNVTYGNTSSKNAITICNLLNIIDIEIYYVTRCYLTRHGNGWMPESKPITLINNEEEINVTNEWQGNFRVGELNRDLLEYALTCDSVYSHEYDKNLVVTCLDQRPEFFPSSIAFLRKFTRVFGSYSPDSKDFKQLN